jgi:hypothetical protein
MTEINTEKLKQFCKENSFEEITFAPQKIKTLVYNQTFKFDPSTGGYFFTNNYPKDIAVHENRE